MLRRLTRSGPRLSDDRQRRVQPLASARRVPALRRRGRAARQGRPHQGLHHRRRGAAARRQVRSAARSDRTGRSDPAAARDRTLLRGPRRHRSGHHRPAARLLCADLPAARDGASPRDAFHRCVRALGRCSATPAVACLAGGPWPTIAIVSIAAVFPWPPRRWDRHGDGCAGDLGGRPPHAAAGQRHADDSDRAAPRDRFAIAERHRRRTPACQDQRRLCALRHHQCGVASPFRHC